MTWTATKPTKDGWYFYREPRRNQGKPMSAWVFRQGSFVSYDLCRRR